MKSPFDALHAGIESQILGISAGIPDSDAVRQARALPPSAENDTLLGKALSRQLRYREAIEAYSHGLLLDPENATLLRLRAGRYLTTLQPDAAIRDFEGCLARGAEKLDCLYRMGLAYYYAGRYPEAMKTWENCMPLCDDEMGIAVLYWHTLAAARMGVRPKLLPLYHAGMEVGHHTAYEKAMRVWTGVTSMQEALEQVDREADDLEYGITLYGLLWHPDCTDREERLKRLLRRDGFWPSFAYLAAWEDARQNRPNSTHAAAPSGAYL